MKISNRTTARLTVALVALLLAGACGGNPPIEEMNAAEEAIANAELARRCAPEEYRAAERLLEEARQANREGDYDRALTLAESARQQAERARLTAQANREECEEPDEDQSRTTVTETIVEQPQYDFDPVYFGFDRASLDERARETLQQHARYLASNDLDIVIEGHCDSFGTDQYNLALGEARARAVAQYLVSLGIDRSRLTTISYGEFRPVSDTDMALNRRAEFRVRR